MGKSFSKSMKNLNKELWEECILILKHGDDKALVFRNENRSYKLPKVMVKHVNTSLFVNQEMAERKTEEKIIKNIEYYLRKHGIDTETGYLNELIRERDFRVEGNSAIRKRVYYLNPHDYKIDLIMSIGIGKVDKNKVYKSLNLPVRVGEVYK